MTALMLLALASEAASADWPSWRGPNRDGRSPDSGLLKAWPTGGPRMLWQASGIGRGFSSATVANGAVYISGDADGNLLLTALDVNGQRKWQVTHGPAWTASHPGSRGTPTVADGKVYLLSAHGLLRCYDARNGAPVWQVDVKNTYGGRVPNWGYSESPLVYGNAVIVTPGGSNCIVALNRETGQRIWTSSGLSDAAGYASCIAVEFEGIPMIVTLTASGMVAVDARSGRFLWRCNRAVGRTAVCPSPVYADGYVFGASGYGNGGACVKLSVQGGRLNGTQVWETNDMVCHHGGYIIHDGNIYGNHEGGWNCLDLATGQKKWGARGVGKGSICYADGMLYTFSEGNGTIALVQAKPDGYQETGRFNVQGSGQSLAHPIVVGGRLYLRYSDNLYCFNVRGPDYREASHLAKEPTASRPERQQPREERQPRVTQEAPRPLVKPEPLPDTPEEHARKAAQKLRELE